jgi:putative transposase
VPESTSGALFDFESYQAGNNQNQAGKDYVRRAVMRDTSRQVGQTPYLSTCVKFQSHKMQRSVPLESREGELAVALRLEHDPNVEWFLSQPEPLTVKITMKNGRTRGQTCTPDFLVLTSTGVEAIEVKPREALDKLVETRPIDWKRTRKGYRFVPLEKAYKKLGIKYHVVVSDDMSKIESLNIKLLLQVIRANIDGLDALGEKAVTALSQCNYTSLEDLRLQLSLPNLDPLIALIANGTLLCALHKQRIVDASSFLITSDHLGLRVIDEVLSKRDLPEPLLSPLRLRGCRKALADALNRLKVIESGSPRSTFYSLKKKLEEGLAQGLSPLEAMLTDHSKKGNRNNKRPLLVIETLDKYLADKKSSASFDEYVNVANESHSGEQAVDPKTFKAHLKQMDAVELARDFGGNRSANLARSASDATKRSLKASRAFEIAVCDSYLIDLHVVLANVDEVKVTKKAWASVLKDLYSGAVLAIWVDVRQPSRVSVACMIRQCIRIHKRLPETIRTDRGSEYRSDYMAALAAHYGFNHELKPAGYPQSGGQIESYFETVRKQFLKRLPGNVVDIKSARSTSGSHSPDRKANIPLIDFIAAAQNYIHWYNNSTSNENGYAPSFALRTSLNQITSSGVLAEYDGDAVLITAVDVREFTLDPQRGLHINGRHYWSPAFKLHKLKKSKIDVRLEPESPDRVYAAVKGEWVVCYCTNPDNYAGLEHKERVTQAIIASNYSAIKNQVAAVAGPKKHREIIGKILSTPSKPTDLAPVAADDFDPFANITPSNLPSIAITEWKE